MFEVRLFPVQVRREQPRLKEERLLLLRGTDGSDGTARSHRSAR